MGKIFTTKARRYEVHKEINRFSSCLGVFVVGFWFRLVRVRKEKKMVDEKGFEPSTPALRTRCSPS